MADLQDEQYIYEETRRPEPGPTVEGHVPPPPLIAPALLQPPQPPAEPELENSCVVQLGTDILQIGMGTMLFILFIPIQIVRTEFHWMHGELCNDGNSCTHEQHYLMTELSRTVVPCALKNNSLLYN